MSVELLVVRDGQRPDRDIHDLTGGRQSAVPVVKTGAGRTGRTLRTGRTSRTPCTGRTPRTSRTPGAGESTRTALAVTLGGERRGGVNCQYPKRRKGAR